MKFHIAIIPAYTITSHDVVSSKTFALFALFVRSSEEGEIMRKREM